MHITPLMTNTTIMAYRHPIVRDLAWAMESAGLLQSAPEGQMLVTDDECRQFYAMGEGHLHMLDENPAPLLNFLSESKSHRLGIYFEWLLRYWLTEILHVRQLGHNVPIFRTQMVGGKRTLGEFDFLFQMDELPSLQHWEATVKFYLQKIDDQGQSYWIGPGDRDRLDIKLNRLFQHQLRLAEVPEAKAWLLERGTESVRSAGFIKGYLFYPLAADGTFSPHPLEGAGMMPYTISSAHNKGWWLHWEKQLIPAASAEARWVVLAKSRWLSPVRHTGEEASLLDHDSLVANCEKYFAHQNRPLLVAELHWQSTAWLEVARGFVLAPE